MTLTVPERIAETATHFAQHASHGYSQPNRGTHAKGSEIITYSDGTMAKVTASDLDCSELVRQCVDAALGYVAIPYMWTGNEAEELQRVGFTKLAYAHETPRRGDILLKPGHTAVCLGTGRIAEAAYDEHGGIEGSTPGDQTGQEVRIAYIGTGWQWLFRWEGDDMTESDFERIQQMLDRQTAALPKKIWSYVNTKLEKVDVYQILRDCRDMLESLMGGARHGE